MCHRNRVTAVTACVRHISEIKCFMDATSPTTSLGPNGESPRKGKKGFFGGLFGEKGKGGFPTSDGNVTSSAKKKKKKGALLNPPPRKRSHGRHGVRASYFRDKMLYGCYTMELNGGTF
eukprot:scaffold6177_cov47-Attheya_sp.AAC.3